MTIEAIHGAAVDPRVGRVLGERYRVDRLVGRGGMSSVYAATDLALGRTVALKIFASDREARDDFDRRSSEISVLAGLSHPALVTLYDAFDGGDGDGVIVLELVEGIDLRTRLKRGPLEPGAIRLLGRSIADALAYVHARGIVHRDVTPANILLPDDRTSASLPVAKLADFGIARIVDRTRQTSEGSVLGTAHYLSPEQALGDSVGPASDVYSLGLVLLECFTGRRAFPGTGVEALAARLHRPPELPADIDEPWRLLLAECLERDAESRPSAEQLVRRLRRLSRLDTGSAPRAGGGAAELPATESMPSVTIERALTVPATVATAESRRVRLRGQDDDYRGSPATGRRTLLVSAVVGVLIASAALAMSIVAPATDPVDTTPPARSYPAVDGLLGAHLELLQRLVAP